MMSTNNTPTSNSAWPSAGSSPTALSSVSSVSKRVQVSLPVMNGLMASHKRFAESIIEALAEHYKFPKEEAIHMFLRDVIGEEPVRKARGLKTTKSLKSTKVKRESPSIPLPWTGESVEGWCQGLRLNQGLHSQCCMDPSSGGIYCKTCQKQADVNSSGVPTYGNCDLRKAVGLAEYRDPKDQKQSVPYSTVMAKLNITREAAEAEAHKFGMTIPESQFAERKVQRGRPKKDTSASDTDSSGSEGKKRGRGRPKKEKKEVMTSDGDDLIAQLVSAANVPSGGVTSLSTTSLTIKVDGAAFNHSPTSSLTKTGQVSESFSSPSFTCTPPLAENTDIATPSCGIEMTQTAKVAIRKPKIDKAAAAQKKAAKAAELLRVAENKRREEEEAAAVAKAGEVEAEDVEYEEKEIDGVKYAFAEDFLYSLTTGCVVGYLNPSTGLIEEVDEDDE